MSNDSVACPGNVCCLGVYAPEWPDDTRPHGTVYRFHAAACVHARYESCEPTRADRYEFPTPDAFWEWASAHSFFKRPLTIICHSAGVAIRVLELPERIEDGEFVIYATHSTTPDLPLCAKRSEPRPGLWVDGDPPVIVIMRTRDGRKITVLDLQNWINDPIDAIAQDVDARCLLPLPTASREQRDMARAIWASEVTYCAYNRLCTLVRNLDIGRLRYTIAGQALAGWRHRHGWLRRKRDENGTVLPTPTIGKWTRYRVEPTDQPEPKALEADGYYGGRIECFYKGLVRGPIYKLDVNGSFPSAMATWRMPARLVYWSSGPEAAGRIDDLEARGMIARVRIETDQEPFPVRSQYRVIWALGTYDTVLCGPELVAAVRAGAVKHVYERAKYQLEPLFADYVKSLWRDYLSAVVAGKPTQAKMIKAILRGLYGKFAQRNPRWEYCGGPIESGPWSTYIHLDPETHDTELRRSIGWDAQREVARELAPHASLAIAGWITSGARAQMDRYRLLAGNNHVYYQTVDCLYCDQFGFDNLRSADCVSDWVLGALKLVAVADDAEFRGWCDMRFGAHEMRSPLQNPDSLTVSGETTQSCRERLSSICLRRPDATARVSELPLVFSGGRINGTVQPDGWITPPVIMELPCNV